MSRLEKSFISLHMWEEIHTDIETIKQNFLDEQQRLIDEMEIFRIQEAKNIKFSIDQAIQENFAHYELVYEEFKKFFN
jgi:hypothetical protein